MRSDRLESLASPTFIAALALLVVNDAALKPLLHNALTGKLSDFAGVFALTLFAATLCPRRARLAGVLIAAAFTLWKTSYAEPLIEWLNVVSPFPLGRTVDLTDLAALPMVPLAVWAAPRLAPLPLPRALQLLLVVVALVAFTATSRARYLARDTMDVTQVVAVDETVLQSFFDEIASERRLRCDVCVPLSEGRVYVPEEADTDVRALVVKLDRQQTLYFMAMGYDRERGVRVLARRIRAEIEERFPAIVVIDSMTDDLGAADRGVTVFVVRARGETAGVTEDAQRALLSIVDDVARAHTLQPEPRSPYYHTGDGFEPEYASLRLVPVLDAEGALLVRVVVRNSEVEALERAVTDDLAARLDATFGSDNVTRHTTPLGEAQVIF